jgi:hypothetical protein
VPGYIRDPKILLSAVGRSLKVEMDQVEQALDVLAQSPVAGYTSFSEKEVSVISLYRRAISKTDRVWQNIVEGYGAAWPFAIHEAAELDTFVQRGVNPFVPEERDLHLGDAHAQAVQVEVQFLKAWAKQLGEECSEAAIEATNPFRSIFTSRANLFARLHRLYNWDEPDAEAQESAERFWRRIVPEEF